ncbi:MAG: transporter substrate-binding domain-containing protein [Clostridia bacterium]|nr:transporter substrate-binding domain-containing protein [Clostridia bacterium]
MKKIVAMFMVCCLTFLLCACSADNTKKEVPKTKIGLLKTICGKEEFIKSHFVADHTSGTIDYDFVEYQTLSALVSAVTIRDIKGFSINESTAQYLLGKYSELSYNTAGTGTRTEDFSMVTLTENKEVYDLLNENIKQLKADGTMQALIDNSLTAYIQKDPEPTQAQPHYEGAKTIKIGLTGDLPPMDFVTPDGDFAGFNVELLSEIARREQVNIEYVKVNSGDRKKYLQRGSVDAVFWSRTVNCLEHNVSWSEIIDGMSLTESYFSDDTVYMNSKTTNTAFSSAGNSSSRRSDSKTSSK